MNFRSWIVDVWRCFLAVGLLLGTGLGATPLSAADSPLTPEALAAFFDAALSKQLAQEQLVGATVAVVQGDALLFAKGYGYADLDAGRPVEADRTLFYIGSDGKLFTWTALMQLAEQGNLDLHTDINRYLDFEIPATFADPITLHHLMTHTPGFEEQQEALLAADGSTVLPLREFVMRRLPERVYPPGVVMAYSNYGTALAGYIIERVSGERYEDYITAHLLQPLGMTRSAVRRRPRHSYGCRPLHARAPQRRLRGRRGHPAGRYARRDAPAAITPSPGAHGNGLWIC